MVGDVSAGRASSKARLFRRLVMDPHVAFNLVGSCLSLAEGIKVDRLMPLRPPLLAPSAGMLDRLLFSLYVSRRMLRRTPVSDKSIISCVRRELRVVMVACFCCFMLRMIGVDRQ